MMDIDRVLDRARLKPTTPCPPADIAAAEERVAVRVAMALTGVEPNHWPQPYKDPHQAQAEDDLKALCALIIDHPEAMEHLADSLPDTSMPAPASARVLGGILYLADKADDAGFWWQYAAGGDDPISSYCLYLYHWSLGEEAQGDWWLGQTRVTPATAGLQEQGTRKEIRIGLRVLRGIRGNHQPRRHLWRELIARVTAVVRYVDDDVELALPTGDLADLVADLAADGREAPVRERPCCPEPLPARPDHLQSWLQQKPRQPDEDLTLAPLVERALRSCAEAVACAS